MLRPMMPASLCLALVAEVLCLPADFAARGQAGSAPEPATWEQKLISGDCALFVTFRLADFTADELAKTVLGDWPKRVEEELHVTAYGIDRLTMAMGRAGSVQIVRTIKVYDADKIRENLKETLRAVTSFVAFRDEAGDAPRKPTINKKKVGDKTIYYAGERGDWTQGWCPLDKNTFLQGDIAAIEAMLEGKSKLTAEMAVALAIVSNHSLVMAADGKQLRSLITRKRPPTAPLEPSEEQVSCGAEEKSVLVRGEEKPADEKDDADRMFETAELGVAMLALKPLWAAKSGILRLDVKNMFTLSARIDLRSKDDLDDAELALRSLLYIGREFASKLTKLDRANDFAGMKPLSAPLHKAIKDARIARKDNALKAIITLLPEPGLAKKVRDEIAEAKKYRESIPY